MLLPLPTRPYDNVLVAHDGSVGSGAALAWGRLLARRLPARLIVVAVHEDGEAPPSLPRPSRENYRGRGEIHVVSVGTPWRRLLVEASAREADLIVVGKRGDNSPSARVVGHTTARLASRARAPTLIVPPHCEPIAMPHILVAIDLVRSAVASATQRVAPLAHALQASIELLHVREMTALASVSGLPSEQGWSTPDIRELEAHAALEAQRVLEDLASTASLANALSISAQLRRSTLVAPCIIGEANGGADVLAVAARQHRALGLAWLGGLTMKLLRGVERPLLLLPTQIASRSSVDASRRPERRDISVTSGRVGA